MTRRLFFSSDNTSGVHPAVLQAIETANRGGDYAYSGDNYTQKATDILKAHFGPCADILFVTTGTAANVIALQGVTQSYEAVICSDVSHMHRDECGAPEKFMSAKLLVARSEQGKISPETIAPLLRDTNMVHRVQPRVVSITQCTEWGTVYTLDEMRCLSDYCRRHGMYLHVDGARLCNAAAALKVDLKTLAQEGGIDILSLGGTKNGAMAAEAILVFKDKIAENIRFYQKQAMQLVSKSRFVAAQFEALFADNLWLENARHANDMASALAVGIQDSVEICQPVETNAVFLKLAPAAIEALQKEFIISLWDSHEHIIRLMTSFNTEVGNVEKLIAKIKSIA